jgi:uroporphyrinogen decarboxylase
MNPMSDRSPRNVMHLDKISGKEARQRLEALYGNPMADAMSPYERFDAAVNRRLPDRVPFDFWAVPEVVAKLNEYLQVSDEEELLRLLGVDERIVGPDYIGPEPELLPDGTFYDARGSHRRKVSNEFSTYEEYASFPLAQANNKAEVETYSRWAHSSYWDWASIVPKIARINRGVRYYMRYDVGGIFESAWALYGLDRFLTGLYDRPEVPCAIMDCYTDLFIENVHNLMKAAEGMIDIVYTYDDVAIQNSLIMSPRMWRQYILPRHQRLNAVIKSYGLKILYHSCGAIFPLVNALIDDMHIDVLNPLQPRAGGMDMARLKQEFGGRVAFHGGIDLQETMPHGTTQDVVDEVRARCRVLGPGGGYICTTAHYIQNDSPVENIIALYTAPRGVNSSE